MITTFSWLRRVLLCTTLALVAAACEDNPQYVDGGFDASDDTDAGN